MANHVVVSEPFAVCVHAVRLVYKSLAADHLVLELDVGQLLFQLGRDRVPDHLWGRGQHHFEVEIIVQGLGVENVVVG